MSRYGGNRRIIGGGLSLYQHRYIIGYATLKGYERGHKDDGIDLWRRLTPP